tara:strand:+ start:647 stop:898 length:252 start_codon:yes stop_codon:yes gene_type:complete
MPIYGKSKRTWHINDTLSNNLSTLPLVYLVDNFIVNFFVNHPFFRHLDQYYKNMGTVFALDSIRFTIFNEERNILWMIIFRQG